MQCVAQVEIDEFCLKVLNKHWPNVPKFKDVRDVGKHNLPAADLICGGFPCQDVSLAGKRAGLKGKRSTLWSEFSRIIGEVRPQWVVAENVRGLFTSDNGRFFGNILRDLAQLGYDAEWDCLSAAFFGAPQLRHRVYIIAYPQSNSRRSPGLPYIFIKNRADLGEHRRPASKITWNGISINRKDDTTYINNFPESIFLRVDNGVYNGLDKDTAAHRMKQSGNAVIPQVAEFIGQCIVQAETP